MKFGVVIFPGSNCDDDMIHVLGTVLKMPVVKLWHKSLSLQGLTKGDCIIIPGGFSFGDYLRSGAIAKFSPIMKLVVNFAEQGGYVFGICNGFQVLCEAGLLPGVLLRNKDQRFISKNIYLKAINRQTPITLKIADEDRLMMPIAHADGRYYTDQKTLDDLISNDQILFKYCDVNGDVIPEANINGSVDNIAGICNANKNVFGMMPHPERASESLLGCSDGKVLFESLIESTMEAANV